MEEQADKGLVAGMNQTDELYREGEFFMRRGT